MVFSLHFYILGFASIAVSVATNRLVCLSFGGYVFCFVCLLVLACAGCPVPLLLFKSALSSYIHILYMHKYLSAKQIECD